ncbi:hypothetical protein BJ322DRAFT_449548 [Thelephora terrestris]|uniref:BTB domain-containing protein n=1 Tax=Thelephora terrestris TaxID=56493 RepID=A0A9P6H4B8_9AGAM|nr:hypothetical protein BJ322DRAFT_449548 [Thelephora terrestris]
MLFGDFAESQSKDFNEGIDEEESTEDYGYLSDSDLDDDPLSKLEDPPLDDSGKDTILCEGHEECVEKGKVVKIPDVAFVTFQAFLIYLYTDVIEFARFGSKHNRLSRRPEIANPPQDKVRPSPKSIYRLADKYDVSALKTMALNEICCGLPKCDIVEESFGRFVSQYDEIRSLYVKQLAYVLVEDWTGEMRMRVEKKIDSFAEGNLQYATETVSALWELVKRDMDINAPSIASATSQTKSPAHWRSVKIALIKSIRTGVFFDRKCWAISSNSGERLKPVYFSSTIMNDKVEQVNR